MRFLIMIPELFRNQIIEERTMSDTQTQKYGWNPDMPASLLDKLKADLKHSMLNKEVEIPNGYPFMPNSCVASQG